MRFVDIEAVVVTFLDARVTPPVVTKVPASRPALFVRAWRTGGASANRVLDQPTITVQSWAASSVAASALAEECRRYLFDDYTAMPLVRGVSEITGPYFDPDPVTGVDRYSFTVQLSVRAAR
jgi:hypothetical protein